MTLAAARLRERNASAGGGAFNPATMTGIQGWWDFSTLGLTDGTAIASISDGSANARTASQGTAGSRPLCKTGANGINSLSVGLFDGVDDSLVTAAFTLAQPLTVYVVIAGGNDGPGRYFAGTDLSLRAGWGNSFQQVNNYAGTALSFNTSTLSANPKVVTSVFSGASSLIRVDGVQVVAGDTSTGGIGGGVALGSASAQFWTGKIGEVFFTNVATVSTAAEAYLKAKWGTA